MWGSGTVGGQALYIGDKTKETPMSVEKNWLSGVARTDKSLQWPELSLIEPRIKTGVGFDDCSLLWDMRSLEMDDADNFPIACDTESLADGDNAVFSVGWSSDRRGELWCSRPNSDSDNECFASRTVPDRVKEARLNCNAVRTTTQRFACLKTQRQQKCACEGQKREAREEEETKEGWRANAEDRYRSRDGVMSRSTAVPLSPQCPTTEHYSDFQPVHLAWSRCRSPHAPGLSSLSLVLSRATRRTIPPEGSQEVCVYVRRGACFCSPSVSRADAQLGCSIVQSVRGPTRAPGNWATN